MPRAAWLQYTEKTDRWMLYCWQKKNKEENKTKQKTGIIIITL